ncbi:hypothetical protein K438DRAFT_1812942 [Mycena galopus ATCC 62051]|nr:hypothetical protein K438DRAFT_1812942 [Mycena galopus ATCC 62051]
MSAQNTYEHHGPTFDCFSSKEVAAHYYGLRAARELAIAAPLKRGLEFNIKLQIPQQNPSSSSRPVPFIPGSMDTNEATVSLQLIEALKSGAGGFSQVWTASLVGAPETVLVLKIIQPSMTSTPGLYERWVGWYVSPADLAGHEAWVYRTLAHKQGDLIPYFFGMSTINTPSDEEAWVLVLEFIPGPTVQRAAEEFTSISMMQELCRLSVAAVREFVLGGWMLIDLQGSNFIATGSPGARKVVLIDLYGAHQIPQDRVLDMAYYQARDLFFSVALLVEDEAEGIIAWGKEHIPFVGDHHEPEDKPLPAASGGVCVA